MNLQGLFATQNMAAQCVYPFLSTLYRFQNDKPVHKMYLVEVKANTLYFLKYLILTFYYVNSKPYFTKARVTDNFQQPFYQHELTSLQNVFF